MLDIARGSCHQDLHRSLGFIHQVTPGSFMVALVIQVQELAPVGKDCLPGADHAVEQGHVFSRSTGLQFLQDFGVRLGCQLGLVACLAYQCFRIQQQHALQGIGHQIGVVDDVVGLDDLRQGRIVEMVHAALHGLVLPDGYTAQQYRDDGQQAETHQQAPAQAHV